jgi:predicted dehydrogenase/threonine dehydrogenase-like Zn-dependent dehydrogenase
MDGMNQLISKKADFWMHMKQIVQDVRSGETVVLDVPVPKPGPGMALVRTGASLVSVGTERTLVAFAAKSLAGKARSRPDLVKQVLDKARREGLLTTAGAVFNRLDQPMPLGYSSAGEIVAVGEGLQGYRVGDRVACAGGGYAVHAEYAVVPQNLLAHMPDQVDFESGAFATLGAIALHGFRLAETQVGERVAVVGLGLLGLLAAGIARAAGCEVFGVDLDAARVSLARQMGIEAVLREGAEEMGNSLSHGVGFDVILICADTSSNDPVELAGEMARDRGRVVAVGAVGINVPRKVYYQKELSFIVSRSYGPGRYDPIYEEGGQDYPIGYVRWTEGRNLAAFVELLASGKVHVAPLISHRFPIEQATEAYTLITGDSSEPFLGVLLTYPEIESVEESLHRVTHLGTQTSAATSVVRLGAFGAGNFATAVLFPALKGLDGLELVGLATASGLKSTHVGSRYGFEYATTDEAQILSDERINTIAILTRHHLHAGQVIAALEAGKNVFCEKPLAIRREELQSIAVTLEESGPILMVGFNRRFAPLAVRMKTFLEKVYEPLMVHYRINAGYLPAEHWLHDPDQGGGRIIGEACHFIDFLTYLIGEPPNRVQAKGLPDQGRYCEDNVIITFEFPDGSLGTVTYLAGGDRAFPKERVEAIGGGRVAVLDDFRSLETYHAGGRKVHRSRLRQDKGHRAEWEAFVAALTRGEVPPIPYDHLLAVTQASFLAIESLRSGEGIALDLPIA